MASIKFYERSTIIERIETVLNQINRDYFEGNHGILSVTDNGDCDYVTVKKRGLFVADYDTLKLFDTLENCGQDDCSGYYDLWDYIDNCRYTFPENQESNNQLKTDEELTFSEKRQVALVDILLSESVPMTEFSGLDEWTISLIPHSQTIDTKASTLSELVDEIEQKNKRLKESVEELEQENKRLKESREFWRKLAFSGEDKYQECLKYIASEKAHLNKCIKQLQEEYQELEKNYEILGEKNRELEQSKEFHVSWVDNLKQQIHDLKCAVHLVQQENKQLKSNQLDKSELKPIKIQKEDQSIIDFRNTVKAITTGILPKPVIEQVSKPEPDPTAKKRFKFKLPENFADYQQESDDLINALSCFYNIKKGKWGKDILQFILTPNDTEKAKHSYPDKWKAGLYLQFGQWTVDKVNLSDPDDWEDWFMDINDFADSNGIEIS